MTPDTTKPSREIKFRAWDLDNFNMFYSDREQDSGEGLIIWLMDINGPYFEEPTVQFVNQGGFYTEEVHGYGRPNQVVMQFTGLIDKNGKEIYEGDILSVYHYMVGSYNVCVVWNTTNLGWAISETIEDQDESETSHGTSTQLADHESDALEIIGNIHEHPHLLTATTAQA